MFRKTIARAVCLCLLVLAAVARPSWPEWNVQLVEEGRSYDYTSVALAPSGHPAVATGGYALYYVSFDGVSWVTEIVDPYCTIGETSLAFDPTGRPAISYEYAYTLKLARWNGSRWRIETLDDTGRIDWHSLAFDGSGQPAIAYEWSSNDGDRALKLARTDGAVWTLETVDSYGRPADSVSLAFDGRDLPLIAYIVEEEPWLRLARWSGTAWEIETVYPDRCGHASLAIDPADRPAIAYEVKRDIFLARWDGVDWIHEPVDADQPGSLGVRLAFDGAGLPVIGYLLGSAVVTIPTANEIRLARFDGAAWSIDIHADENVYDALSLCIDALGEPVLSLTAARYWPVSAGHAELAIARLDGTGWLFETLDTMAGAGGSASLAFDGAGLPAIGHTGSGPAREPGVWLSRWTGSTWVSETAATVTDGYSLILPSLAFDATDHPALSFVEEDSHWDPLRLSLTRWDGASWTVESLLESTDLEIRSRNWPSLAFDAAGVPFVAYTEFSEASLSDEVRVVGPGGPPESIDLGGRPSLAADPAGNLMLAYSSSSSDGLTLARLEAGSWNLELVDGGSIAAQSLAFDAAGEPAIGYLVNDGSTRLGLARHHPVGWSLEEVTEASSYAPVSLAFDLAGNPAMSFGTYSPDRRRTGFRLRYATVTGSGWEIEDVDSRGPVAGPRALRFDRDGQPLIAYRSCASLVVATPTGPATLLRGRSALGPGWKGTALPLTSWNDDETSPFPLATASPGSTEDTAAPADALVLYRLLWEGDRPARNTLRLTRQPAGVGLSY